jgi:hypothetical protein
MGKVRIKPPSLMPPGKSILNSFRVCAEVLIKFVT